METIVIVKWDIYVQCHRHISSGTYVNNVKHMYINTPGHIVDCSEFMRYL